MEPSGPSAAAFPESVGPPMVAKPLEHVEPVGPLVPLAAAQPVGPAQPLKHVEPVWPLVPLAAAQPVGPAQPAQPWEHAEAVMTALKECSSGPNL